MEFTEIRHERKISFSKSLLEVSESSLSAFKRRIYGLHERMGRALCSLTLLDKPRLELDRPVLSLSLYLVVRNNSSMMRVASRTSVERPSYRKVDRWIEAPRRVDIGQRTNVDEDDDDIEGSRFHWRTLSYAFVG